MIKFHIIRDYRNFLYSSVKPPDSGVDLNALQHHLETAGVNCQIWNFRNIDLTQDWAGALVIYQSSEDRGLFYKDYIEDVILALKKRGAILIPDFFAFRCHHNKSFQELIREIYLPDSKIKSRVFGCLEDLEREIETIEYPCVIKTAAGAKSTGVQLAKTKSELRRVARRMSATIDPVELLKDLLKRLIRKDYVPVSQHKRKFLVQTFLPGLSGDYKVLVYGNKAFAIERNVAPKDFRASGSGLLIVDQPISDVIIRYAFDLARKFEVPFGAFDIAMHDGKPELIEFQFVTFGTTTLFISNRYYEHNGSEIHELQGNLELEHVLAEALIAYAEKLPKKANTQLMATL